MPPAPFIKCRFAYNSVTNPNLTLVNWYKPVGAIADPYTFVGDFAAQVSPLFGAAFLVLAPGDAEYSGVAVALNQGGVTYNATSTDGAGAGAGSFCQSDQAAICIQKRTGHGGRTGIGRWFVGALNQGIGDGNKIDPTSYGFFTALGNMLMGDQTVDGVTCHAQLYSRKDNAFYQILNINVDSRYASQDRRSLRTTLN